MRAKRSCRRESGFTLIELMIVVAIIGLLATMAIPNYLAMSCRAKRSEAKMQLSGMYSGEKMFFSEYNFLTTDLAVIDWAPQQTPLYLYGFAAAPLYPVGSLDLGNGEVAYGSNNHTMVQAVYDKNLNGVLGDSPQEFDTSKMVDFQGAPWTGAEINGICSFAPGNLHMCAYGNVDGDSEVEDLYIDQTRTVVISLSDC